MGEKISLRHLDTVSNGRCEGEGCTGEIKVTLLVMTVFFLQLSRESFAPCMRHLHETLRKEHHLRHFGRLQYGLFLKSINLTLDQALTFWKEEFTKKMEPEKVGFDGSKTAIVSRFEADRVML